MHRRILPFLLLSLILFTSQAFSQTGWPEPYENGVVSSADSYASAAGIEILEKGGNAIDAAIAVQFALAVTLPRAGNIGGGGFMVLHLNDGIVRTLDFREKAPAKAHRDMYLDQSGNYTPELSRQGALAAGVPGTVDGMLSALERYGTLPLEVIMEPAILLARDGYELNFSHADDLNSRADQLSMFESSKKYFVKPDGEKWKKGDLFIQADLAQTLRRIARYGRDGFYSGVTANQIIQEMRKSGGLIDLRDLRQYKSEWRDPIVAEFKDNTFYMMAPPSSGGVVFKQILQMIEDHEPEQLGFNSAAYIHLLAEAMRRSFSDRNYYLGDPDHVNIPMARLLSKEYAENRMRNFNATSVTSSDQIAQGEFQSVFESSETTHFSVIDRHGNAVAVTTTLNGSFGSYLSVTNAGFLLNNEMDDFSAKPGEPNMFGLIGAEANAIAPGKRMLSSMSPTIVTKNGQVKMIAGAAGGPRIITATLQTILNGILFDMNPQQAISATRFHHQWLPDLLYVEPFSISVDTQSILKEYGHEISERSTIGRVHIIYVGDDNLRYGAADPRGDGSVTGY
ncbi:MAG: gamma-glutamyltransferase [Balneolaceae bacterium]